MNIIIKKRRQRKNSINRNNVINTKIFDAAAKEAASTKLFNTMDWYFNNPDNFILVKHIPFDFLASKEAYNKDGSYNLCYLHRPNCAEMSIYINSRGEILYSAEEEPIGMLHRSKLTYYGDKYEDDYSCFAIASAKAVARTFAKKGYNYEEVLTYLK